MCCWTFCRKRLVRFITLKWNVFHPEKKSLFDMPLSDIGHFMTERMKPTIWKDKVIKVLFQQPEEIVFSLISHLKLLMSVLMCSGKWAWCHGSNVVVQLVFLVSFGSAHSIVQSPFGYNGDWIFCICTFSLCPS